MVDVGENISILLSVWIVRRSFYKSPGYSEWGSQCPKVDGKRLISDKREHFQLMEDEELKFSLNGFEVNMYRKLHRLFCYKIMFY